MASLLTPILILLNPFGAFDALDTLSRSIMIRALSVQMPSKMPPAVVVLIDDDWLRYRRSEGKPANWPLSASDWSGVVARIDRANPKAIALDVAFIDDRADPGLPLMRTIFSQAGTRAPLIVAAGSTESAAVRPISQGLEDLILPKGPVRLASVIVDGSPASIHPYSFLPDSDGHPNMVRTLVELETKRRLPERIELLWPSPAAEECALHDEAFRGGIESGCAYFPNNWAESLAVSALASLFNGMCNNEREGRLCRFVPPLYISASPTPTLTLAALEDPRRSDQVDELLRDALVFVGQDFAFSQDRTYSPVYGSVPGVSAHAVAYQNAMSLPNGGLVDPEGFLDRIRVQTGVAAGFLLALILIERLLERSALKHPFSAKLLETGILAIASVFVGLLVSGWSHYGPANWLGISTASATALICTDMILYMYDREPAKEGKR